MSTVGSKLYKCINNYCTEVQPGQYTSDIYIDDMTCGQNCEWPGIVPVNYTGAYGPNSVCSDAAWLHIEYGCMNLTYAAYLAYQPLPHVECYQLSENDFNIIVTREMSYCGDTMECIGGWNPCTSK